MSYPQASRSYYLFFNYLVGGSLSPIDQLGRGFTFTVENYPESLRSVENFVVRELSGRHREAPGAAFGGGDTLYTYPPFAEDRQRRLLSQ